MECRDKLNNKLSFYLQLETKRNAHLHQDTWRHWNFSTTCSALQNSKCGNYLRTRNNFMPNDLYETWVIVYPYERTAFLGHAFIALSYWGKYPHETTHFMKKTWVEYFNQSKQNTICISKKDIHYYSITLNRISRECFSNGFTRWEMIFENLLSKYVKQWDFKRF